MGNGMAAVGGGKRIGPLVKHQPSGHVVIRRLPFGWHRSKRTHKVVGVHPARLFGEERNHSWGAIPTLGSDGAFGR